MNASCHAAPPSAPPARRGRNAETEKELPQYRLELAKIAF